MSHPKSRKALAALLSGVLTALALPGFGWAPLAFVCLIPLLFALDGVMSLRHRFALGLVFGLVLFALDQRWILTLYRFSPWVLPGFLLAVLFLALPFGLFGVLTRGRSALAGWSLLISAPAAFVLMEFLRAQGPLGTGFSMLYTSLYRLPSLIQLAGWFGSWAVSSLLVGINVCLFLVLRRQRARYAWGLVAAFALLIVPMARPVPEAASERSVAVISSTVDQTVKLDSRNLGALTERYVSLGRLALESEPSLIVFPESILPAFILGNPSLLERFEDLAIDGKARVLFGTGVYDPPEIRNEVALLDASGELVGTYAMVRPVPFGETIPGRRLWSALGLDGLMNSFLPVDLTPGKSYDPVGGIGTPICFESTFPDAARASTAAGARVLAVVTNDAWFDGSSELYAHFSCAIFRAVETGRDVIHAANGGVSGLIDARGRILAETTVEGVTAGTLHERVQQTLYVRWGDGPWMGLLVIGLSLSWGLRRARRA